MGNLLLQCFSLEAVVKCLELKEILANNIGLPKERVSIRDTSFIENINGINDKIKGPDIITPIGIAMEGASEKY